MISALYARVHDWWRPNPYANPMPEPVQPVPELLDRVQRARADVHDMTIAADMNTAQIERRFLDDADYCPDLARGEA